MEIKPSNISSKFASENKKTIDKNLLCYTLPPAQTAKAVSARSILRSPTASVRPARDALSRPMAQLASLEPVRPPAAVGWDRTATHRFQRGKNRRPSDPPQTLALFLSLPFFLSPGRRRQRHRRQFSPARARAGAPPSSLWLLSLSSPL